MADELAREIQAMVFLHRAANAAAADRKRLRETSEQFAALLLLRLRVGDTARLGSGVVYAVEQITWPRADADPEGQDGAASAAAWPGVRALLRNDHVLAAGTRKHNSIRVQPLGPRLTRVRTARQQPGVCDLQVATDEVRIAFANEQAEVVEGFGFSRQADHEQLDAAAMKLLAGIVNFLATPD